MEKIEWDEKYSVNISKIDEDHKKLFQIINKANDAINNKYEPEKISEILNEMTMYALNHFKTEEDYMAKFEYSEYELHKKEHLAFIKKTVDYCKSVMEGNYNIAENLLEFLVQWLTGHIQSTDRKYIECFKKNGLE